MALFEETGNYQPKEGRKETGGKKHTIKSRTKATTAFALRQVRDAMVAASVIGIVQNLTLESVGPGLVSAASAVSTIPTIGLIAIGAASFMGSKKAFKVVKKHIIKKRETGKISKMSLVADALTVAGPLTALLVGGYAPAAIVGIGVGAVTLARKIHANRKLKKQQEEQEVRTR